MNDHEMYFDVDDDLMEFIEDVVEEEK